MSFAEFERFAVDLQTNEVLRAEATKAEAGMPPETPLANAIAFAATKGYEFTADDMKERVKAGAHAAGKELTDAELGGIVGGFGSNHIGQTLNELTKMLSGTSAGPASTGQTQGQSPNAQAIDSIFNAVDQTYQTLRAIGSNQRI